VTGVDHSPRALVKSNILAGREGVTFRTLCCNLEPLEVHPHKAALQAKLAAKNAKRQRGWSQTGEIDPSEAKMVPSRYDTVQSSTDEPAAKFAKAVHVVSVTAVSAASETVGETRPESIAARDHNGNNDGVHGTSSRPNETVAVQDIAISTEIKVSDPPLESASSPLREPQILVCSDAELNAVPRCELRDLRSQRFDLVHVARYLWRPLFPVIRELVRMPRSFRFKELCTVVVSSRNALTVRSSPGGLSFITHSWKGVRYCLRAISAERTRAPHLTPRDRVTAVTEGPISSSISA